MGLLDDLTNRPVDERVCSFGRIRAELSEKEQAALDRAIADINATPREERCRPGSGGLTIAWLHNVLKNNGYKVGRQTLNDHLRGVCLCRSLTN